MKYVLGFAFDGDLPETKVLLIRKTKPAWQKGRLNGVGGKIEPGETSITAIVREFQEETTIQTQKKDWTLRGIISGGLNSDSPWEIHVYATHLDGVLNPWMPSPTEEMLVVRKVDSLWQCRDLIFNLHWMIPYCLDGNMEPFNVVDNS